MRLNTTKPYGKWCPPERGIFYEQDGRYFGVDHGEVTIGGVPVNGGAEPEPAPKPEAEMNGTPILNAATLLEQADKMHYQRLRKAAQAILGKDCPSLKADLLAALKATVAEKAAEADGPKPKPERAKKDHGPQRASNGVDLVKWGTGKERALFGDVVKAIRELHHKQVDNARDAINFLIDEGIVTPEEAINV